MTRPALRPIHARLTARLAGEIVFSRDLEPDDLVTVRLGDREIPAAMPSGATPPVATGYTREGDRVTFLLDITSLHAGETGARLAGTTMAD